MAIALDAVGTPATGTTALAVTIPSGATIGSVMVLCVVSSGSAATNVTGTTGNTGWTVLDTATDTGGAPEPTVTVLWKVCGSGDPGATVTCTFASTTGTTVGTINTYTGVDTTTPFEAHSATFEAGAGSTAHVTPSITTTKDTDWILTVFGDRSGSTWTPPTGFSERSDTASGATASMETADSNGTVAHGTISETGTGTTSTSTAVMWIGALQASGGGGGTPQIPQQRTFNRLRFRRQQPPVSLPSVATAVQPVNAPVVIRTPQLQRAPAQRIVPGAQTPPVIVPVIRSRQAVVVQRQPVQRINTGRLPRPKSSVPVIQLKLIRIPARSRGTVSGPLAPGQVAIVTPVRPVVLVSPLRAPPRKPAQRIITGMTPGRGLSGIPPMSFIQSHAARLVRAPRMALARGERGSLTVPAPKPVILRDQRKIRPVPSRLIPGSFIPAGVIYQPVIQRTQLTKPAWRVVRAPKMSVRAGMTPGKGLSGLPPTAFTQPHAARLVRAPRMTLAHGERGSLTAPVPVPVVLKDKKRIRPVASRLVPGAYFSSAPVYPVVIQQTRLTKPVWRAVRQPAQRLRAGMTPGKGLSGLPPTALTASHAARLVRAPAQRIARGERGSLTAPKPVAIVLRNRNRIRAVVSRLWPFPSVPYIPPKAVYGQANAGGHEIGKFKAGQGTEADATAGTGRIYDAKDGTGRAPGASASGRQLGS